MKMTRWKQMGRRNTIVFAALILIAIAPLFTGCNRSEQRVEAMAEQDASTGHDGHDHGALSGALRHVPFTRGKPSAVVARTVKGKGIAAMEDRLGWHYFNVPEDKLDAFLEELDRGTAGRRTPAGEGKSDPK